MRFFAQLLPALDISRPVIYFAGREPDTTYNLVIMEDVAAAYRFPAPHHAWTMDEISAILRTYARFHTSGKANLPGASQRSWLVARHEQRILERKQEIPAMVRELEALGIWPAMPGLPRLFSWLLAQTEFYLAEPPTLLHNDVYPPNAALPNDDSSDVMLFDWEMVGWGVAEMDLAFMFLQPFGSHRGLDRVAALDHYWRERAALTGQRPAQEERQARQLYADALWAFWLVPVAHRLAKRPYPPGSLPRLYWESMWPVLGERLRSLSRPWQTVLHGGS